MADHSKIEWTDATWNPITGCTLVDEGCRHCYAAHLITSWPAIGNHPSRKGLARKNAAGESKFTGEVRFNEQWLDQPLRWKKPRKIFVCAHGDLFHPAVPDEWIDKVFAVMALAPQHTFQVLTKRPDRAQEYIADPQTAFRVAKAMDALRGRGTGEEEVIVPVAGFPGYFASSLGFIYSDKRGSRRTLSPDIGEAGHRRVQLARDGIKTRILVHRIVLEAFVGPPPSGSSEGRHLDGDPSHNAINNLAWGEPGENWDDSKRHGTHRRYSKLSAPQAEDIRARHAKGETGEALAREFGISATQIRNIARGDQWALKAPIEWPLRSVWLGTSISDQASADLRIPQLLATPAAVRFLSAEPLLGAVDIDEWLHDSDCADTRKLYRQHGDKPLCHCGERPVNEVRIDWVIVGGESGPNARSMHPDWARSLRDQCAAAVVPFLFKQWGEFAPTDRPREWFHHTPDREAGCMISRWPTNDSDTMEIILRIGKTRAGRLLDGIEHNGFPQEQSQ